jgi:hypothetical protein
MAIARTSSGVPNGWDSTVCQRESGDVGLLGSPRTLGNRDGHDSRSASDAAELRPRLSFVKNVQVTPGLPPRRHAM